LNEEAAADYAQRHVPHALIIARDGHIVLERYAGGYTHDKPHALYSGTKSFWGVVAAAAQEDGLLSLEEPVAQTIEEWRSDPRKSRVTVRDLLQLTSGFGFGGLGSAVPTFDKAIATELKNEPGRAFTYGGVPLQVFGALLQRKLAQRRLSPHDYLRERILDPIGLRVASWRTLKDGTQPLSTGAFVAAGEWLKFGEFASAGGVHQGKAIVAAPALAMCFQGSRANPSYGLGFWLRQSDAAGTDAVAYASGAGGQAMYIIPWQQTVVVRFGASSSFRHETFLKRLFSEASARRALRFL